LFDRRGHAWIAVAAVHAVASIVVSRLEGGWLHFLDWQGAVAAFQPWRVFTASWVHWSPQHLAMNLAAAAALAVLGWSLALPKAAAHAWLLAWPLSQVVSLAASSPAHLGGLSGTLHAGAAVAAVWSLLQGRARSRTIGALLAAALVLKLAWEWLRGPQPIAGSDAVTWPLIHLAGALCGAAITAMAAIRAAMSRAGR
jgi:membrane associated rhomboid family serine protease